MLEVEVKFIIPSIPTFWSRLLLAGGRVKKGRIYERNEVYDTPELALRGAKKLLRLRQDESVRLTFKGEPQEKVESEAKVREEIEVSLNDFSKMALILSRLGYAPAVVYEKYRETIQIGEVEAVLDEMPYGNFIELEGPEVEIKRLAAELGLDWSQRVLTNYLGLFAQVKETYDLTFQDLTFENFEGIEVDWGKINLKTVA